MTNKSSKYVPAAAVAVIILALAGWQYAKNRTSAPAGQPNQNQNGQPATEQKKSGPEANQLTGTLKVSDNPKKGNLMLDTQDHTIYLFTGRDFSPLLNKQVVMIIDGSLESFRLVDITVK